jgi:hypothetical protein
MFHLNKAALIDSFTDSARFYGVAVFFVEEEERSERYKHVESVNESGRVSAGVTYLSESWDQTRHKRSPLIGRPISEQSTPNKTGDTTLPGITAHLPRTH